jgi:type III pantothenate kinase
MNLAVDIGNTQVKFGVFENDELLHVFNTEESIDEILSSFKIENAIVSKTGSKNFAEITVVQEKKIKTIFLSHELQMPVKILYETPQTLGADRIAGSVAANFLFRNNNVLKIDFGTCITFDFINSKNEYCGGAISPGMMMRFKALHNYTAKLPLIDPMQFDDFELTGKDTSTAILSGVVNGIKEEVAGIIKEYNQRFSKLKVVATGGDAGLFVALLKSEIFARPYLVLEGLNRILNYNLP